MIELIIGPNRRTVSWEEFEALTRSGRVPADAQIRAGALTGGVFVRADTLDTWKGLVQDGGAAVRDAMASSPPPWVAMILCGLSFRIWWWNVTVFPNGPRQMAFATPAWFEGGDWWRLFSYGLDHQAFLHVFMNSVWLAVVGTAVERLWGSFNTLGIFVAGTVWAAFATAVFVPDNGLIGSSGGVFGLIGAVISFGAFRGQVLPKSQRVWFGLAMLPYAIGMLASGFRDPSVANTAHVAGFLSGLALGVVIDPPRMARRPRWNGWVWAGLSSVTMIGLTIPWWGGLGAMPSSARSAPSPGGEVVWPAPAGWVAGTDRAGRFGVVSPASRRTLAVSTGWGVQPVDPLDRVAGWRDRVLTRWPEARLGPESMCAVAGTTGLSRAADLGDGWLRICSVARGRGYVDVSQGSSEDPLADPLLTAFVADIRWADPPDLVAARLLASGTDVGVAELLAAATLEIDNGHVDAARERLESVVRKDPSSQNAWSALARIARNETEIDAVLSAATESATMSSVATALEWVGRRDDAVAVLRLAAARWPADRDVRRHRIRLNDSPVSTAWPDVPQSLAGARQLFHDDAHEPAGVANHSAP